MKTKLFSLLIVLTVCLVSCGENSVGKQEQNRKSEETYKIVTPTKEEIDEIAERLNPILSTYFEDYDSESDNIYYELFGYNHLSYI